jgi:uncharacterized protein
MMAEPNVELRAPRWRVTPRARWYWAVLGLRPCLLAAAAESIWWLVDDRVRAAQFVVAVLSALAALAYLMLMPVWRYRVHRWEVTPDAVYTQRGWATVERRIAPLSRIQTVDTERGPVEQLFRLAHVTVTTASAAGPLAIHGLDVSTADRITDQLTATAQAARGDAT